MATAAAPPDNAGEQVPPSPGRHSLSGPEFRELAYKAKRFAQALGTRTRRMMVEDAREGGGAGGGRWAGAATGVGLGSNEVLGRALSRFREGVERLPGGERMRGVGAVVGGTRTNTFEALRPAMEDHLRRVAIPKNYRFKSSGTHYSATNTSSWEYAKANISRVEKLGAWLHSSRHPSKKKLESVLWTGLEVVLDCLTRQDVGGGLPFAFLDIFCTSLRELATVLPSSLNYIQTRGILEDVEVQALMGFIYAYILELVVAPARCIAPFFQGYVGTAGGCSTGGGYSGGGAGGTSGIIRGTLRQHITHGAQHLSPRLPAAAGTSSFRGAPRSPASRPPMSSSGAGATEADSSTTPGPPQISSANRAPISRDYPSTTHWENQVRSILEKVIYHSRLVQSELVQLEASQQRERFDVIARLFEEAEEARKKEGEERRKLQELEEKGKVEVKERSSLAPDQSSKDATTQGGNPPAVTSASALPSSLDISQQLPPSATRPSPLPRIITEIDLTTQLTAYNSAKAHREGVLRRLLTEAGKIRCDVCCFTAYDVSGNVGTPGAGATLASSITEEDSSVKFSSNINELAKILIGGAERSGGHDQGKGDKDGNGDYTSVGKEKPTLFKLFVVNENSLEALRHIDPKLFLSSLTPTAPAHSATAPLKEPNLWSFARTSTSSHAFRTSWHFINANFPNVELGYGPEARIYAVEARDETAYFYDTTWKIYWANPLPNLGDDEGELSDRGGNSTTCPVAILVLPENDVPVSRPIDPTSPGEIVDIEKSRKSAVELYKRLLYMPLKERGGLISGDDLAVQTLQETRRRWRAVLDKMRHFVGNLTDLLYVVASSNTVGLSRNNNLPGNLGLAHQVDLSQVSAQVFKILIGLNRYESMFIETISYLSQLADEELFLSAAATGVNAFGGPMGFEYMHGLNPQMEESGESGGGGPGNSAGGGDYFASSTSGGAGGMSGSGMFGRRGSTYTAAGLQRAMSSSRLLNSGLGGGYGGAASSKRVSWKDVKRGHQDLLDALRATKRQAESLRAIIYHHNSIRESRLATHQAHLSNLAASEATKQTASMRRMTILTFIFLPGTFMAAIFGMNVFELGQGDIGIWVFFAVAVPFAGGVLACWVWFEYFAKGEAGRGGLVAGAIASSGGTGTGRTRRVRGTNRRGKNTSAPLLETELDLDLEVDTDDEDGDGDGITQCDDTLHNDNGLEMEGFLDIGTGGGFEMDEEMGNGGGMDMGRYKSDVGFGGGGAGNGGGSLI